MAKVQCAREADGIDKTQVSIWHVLPDGAGFQRSQIAGGGQILRADPGLGGLLGKVVAGLTRQQLDDHIRVFGLYPLDDPDLPGHILPMIEIRSSGPFGFQAHNPSIP
jgi:hypothetical protein